MPNQTTWQKSKENRAVTTAIDYIEVLRKDIEKELTFFVPGHPVPQGSKNAAVVRKSSKNGKNNQDVKEGPRRYRAIMWEQEAKQLKPWRNLVAKVAAQQKPGDWETDGFFGVWVLFFFARPAYHFDKDGVLREKYSRLVYKKTKPDADKCLRAINDALTGVLFTDDAKVIPNFAVPLYAEPYLPGALVSVVKLRGDTGPFRG